MQGEGYDFCRLVIPLKASGLSLSILFLDFCCLAFHWQLSVLGHIYNSMNQLAVESLSKSFDSSSKVLSSINFTIDKGDFLVVLGPSGCGKTTLLRIISGLEAADSGQIYIAGKDVTKIEPKYRDVAMVFQDYALYPHMTVFENLAFALKIRKLPKAAVADKVRQTADIIGLSKFLNRRPKQLSGGQRQRVALGRAIVRNPALFLFDEAQISDEAIRPVP